MLIRRKIKRICKDHKAPDISEKLPELLGLKLELADDSTVKSVQNQLLNSDKLSGRIIIFIFIAFALLAAFSICAYFISRGTDKGIDGELTCSDTSTEDGSEQSIEEIGVRCYSQSDELLSAGS